MTLQRAVISAMSKTVHQKLDNLIADHGERKPPIAFGGRENVIASVSRLSQRLIEPDRFSGGDTFVIGGPPGAGKTSLVDETMKRLSRKVAGRRIVRSVFCESPSAKEAYPNLIWDLTAALTGTDREQLIRQFKSFYALELNVVEGMVRGDYGRESKPPQANGLNHILSSIGKPAKHPVVVFIDEAQNVRENSDIAELIETFHTQTKLPILLVCAGLANTRDRLHELRLVSRSTLKHYFPLGLLEADETLQIVKDALDIICEKTGVEPTNKQARDVIAERIAIESDNWPRHLTCYLIALCEELKQQDKPSLKHLPLEHAIERGNGYRQEYYQERVNTSKFPVSILDALYQAIQSDPPLSQLECEGTLEQLITNHQGVGALPLQRRFPTGEAAFEVVRRLGLVTTDGADETCRVPIPSMEAFVREKARAHRAVPCLAAQRQAVS